MIHFMLSSHRSHLSCAHVETTSLNGCCNRLSTLEEDIMPFLNADVLYEIINQIALLDTKTSRETLLNIAPTSRAINDSIRSLLFDNVYWPHPKRNNVEEGLLFFPERLWPHFKSFHLDWPDDWPDCSPPKWGENIGVARIYQPKHLDKLEEALPRMHHIHTFQVTCPFDPPTKLLHSLVRCSNIKVVKVTDTPLYTPILPLCPESFAPESLTFTTVGEAVRMGESPYEKRFQNLVYFTRGYRKKFLNVKDGSLAARVYSAQRYIQALCRPELLQKLVLSAIFVTVAQLRDPNVLWPCLATLVLTGSPPPVEYAPLPGELATLLTRAPRLKDLRILLSEPRLGPAGELLLVEQGTDMPADSPSPYAQLTSLALSNAYRTQGMLRLTTNLIQLAVCAVISPPRIPTALRRNEIEELLVDLEAGGRNQTLRHIRLISEDNLDASFYLRLGSIFPALEVVEVEICGYQDALEQADLSDWVDALVEYKHIRNIRIAIPFPGCSELGHGHSHFEDNNPVCVRLLRLPCAEYLAARIPTLRRIGLQYRARTIQRRHEDRWLDYDVVRLRSGEVNVVELGPSWYRFPEVFEPMALRE